jgi:hypothetical protein
MSMVVSKMINIVRLKTMVLHALPPLLARSVISYTSDFLLGSNPFIVHPPWTLELVGVVTCGDVW